MIPTTPLRHYLALDQAPLRIGYSIGSAEMLAPLSGVYEPPRNSMGSVRDWLDTTLKVYHVHSVCCETPFFHKITPKYAGPAHELLGVIRLVCEDHELPLLSVSPSEWRARFLGVTQAPKGVPRARRRAWLKERAKAACAARKWTVQTDDEADACGILDWLIAHKDEDYRNRTARQPALELEGAA